MDTFDVSRLISEADLIHRGAFRQLQWFALACGVAGSIATAIHVTLPNPATTISLLPFVGNDSGKIITSSPRAVVMLRINSYGPWLPFSAGDGAGYSSLSATIVELDYYVLQADPVTPQLVGIFAVNVSGSTASVTSGSYQSGEEL